MGDSGYPAIDCTSYLFGGHIAVTAGTGVSDPFHGEISITGGIYAQRPADAYLAGGYSVSANRDEATMSDYPWSITSNPVYYINPDGTEGTCLQYYVINADNKPLSLVNDAVNKGWYIVSGNVDYGTQSIQVSGNVNLILEDGCSLTVTGPENKAGITVSDSNSSLTIYAQLGDTGKLTAKGGTGAAGIGGAIYSDGVNITIHGGTIEATGGDYGAGIGGGYGHPGSNITVTGGTVTATGGKYGAAGIGGATGAASNITIRGGYLCASGTSAAWSGAGKEAEEIGRGCYNSNGSNSATNVKIYNGYFSKQPNESYIQAGSVSAANTDTDTCEAYPYRVILPVSYVTADGTAGSCSSYTTLDAKNKPTELTSGWYVVHGLAEYDTGITVTGIVNLILKDGSVLDVSGEADYAGISVNSGAQLNIYVQTKGTGTITATGGENAAGIGSDASGYQTGRITIYGGKITARGGYGAAGIGGGSGKSGGYVTVYGGTITAEGGQDGAGIGNGSGSRGGSVMIYGGVITAGSTTAQYAIGDSSNSKNCEVKIYGGKISAKGTADYSGISAKHAVFGGTFVYPLAEDTIGDGFEAQESTDTAYPYTVRQKEVWYVSSNDTTGLCYSYTRIDADHIPSVLQSGWYVVYGNLSYSGNIRVSGNANLILLDDSALQVTCSETGKAGISVNEGNSLVIYGQTENTGALTATGALWGAGIGGDDGNTSGTITIYGGTIHAQGGNAGGAGIGGGRNGNSGTISIYGGRISANAGESYNQASPAGSRIGGGGNGTDGTCRLCSGIFTFLPEDAIVAKGCTLQSNTDSNTSDVYPYMIQCTYFVAGDGNKIPIQEFTVIDADEQPETLYTGFCVVLGTVTYGTDSSITISGNVNLVLADGCSLTVTGAEGKAGISVSGSSVLRIYGQTEGNGMLTAKGGISGKDYQPNAAAGIGGDVDCSGGNITIYAGIIDATGGAANVGGVSGAAGIGGGCNGSAYNISIYGGTVTARGTKGGAGIGGGSRGSLTNLQIAGGTVTAYGGNYAAGIGAGENNNHNVEPAYCDGVTITGGTVTAIGAEGGAGIGGGYGFWTMSNENRGGACRNIEISGGTVIAKGSHQVGEKLDWAAGIGGGGCMSDLGGGVATDIYVYGGCLLYCQSEGMDVGAGMGEDGLAEYEEIHLCGGYYTKQPTASSIADGFSVTENTDPETADQYPYTVVYGLPRHNLNGMSSLDGQGGVTFTVRNADEEHTAVTVGEEETTIYAAAIDVTGYTAILSGVYGTEGQPVAIASDGSFTMPAGNVTVTAQYVRKISFATACADGSFTLSRPTVKDCIILIARYDADGRFESANYKQFAVGTSEGSVSVPTGNGSILKFFILDTEYIPQCLTCIAK